MVFDGIANNIIAKSVTSPRLSSIADRFGGVMSKITGGSYKVGLSRTGYFLSTMVKPCDKLSVKEGIVSINGKPSFSGPELFKGISRKDIEVTPTMCTTQGMISSLRWDIIGNAPELHSSISSLLFKGMYLGAYLTSHYNNNMEFGVFTVFCALTVIPFHRLIRYSTGSRDKEIKLSNVEEKKARIIEGTSTFWHAGYAPLDNRNRDTILIKKSSWIQTALSRMKKHIFWGLPNIPLSG